MPRAIAGLVVLLAIAPAAVAQPSQTAPVAPPATAAPPATLPPPTRGREPWAGYPEARAGHAFVGIAGGVSVADVGLQESACPGCTHAPVGPALRTWLGIMARDDLAPVLTFAFAGRSLTDPVGSYDSVGELHATLGLRYWLGTRPWVEAAVGRRVVAYGGPQPDSGPSGWLGWSGALAAGYELRPWPTFALVVVADVGATFAEERELSAGLTLGLDWWFLDLGR
jgi:hypothetical protein